MITQIIKDISNQIFLNEEYGNDPDEASWNYETGVIITTNEAKELIEYIKHMEESALMKIGSMTAQITDLCINTSLEPYIGMVFQIKRRGERKTLLFWYDNVDKSVSNKYLKFINERG